MHLCLRVVSQRLSSSRSTWRITQTVDAGECPARGASFGTRRVCPPESRVPCSSPSLGWKTPNAEITQAGPGSTACDRSFLLADLQSQYDEEQLPRARSADSPRECALCLRAAARNRCDEGVGAALPASSHNDRFLFRIGGQSAQGFFSPVFQNKGNRCPQVFEALFLGPTLTVGARHLGTVRDKPWIVSFDDRCELVAHIPIPYPEAGALAVNEPGR